MKLQAVAAVIAGFVCGFWVVSTYLKANIEPDLEKGKVAVDALLAGTDLPVNPEVVLLRAFKQEGEIELWAGDGNAPLKLVKTYSITAKSGRLGPKRKEGDRQVPEGFYKIVGFNRNSSYHLSMKINYPNASDLILSDKDQPGSDIFIHGKAVTIGCIPIGDEAIEELYALCEAVSKRSTIQVHIFPARLDAETLKPLQREHSDNPQLMKFWRNLQEGYASFERTHRPLRTEVSRDGSYRF